MKRVRVGIVGFGTVGKATADIISKHADLIYGRSGVRLDVRAVCRRSGVKPQDAPLGARSVSDWRELVQADDVDVLVETMGGTGQSLQFVRASPEQGKPVVTANKNLLAEHGDELFALAASQNLPVGFEASVAGGIPILLGCKTLGAAQVGPANLIQSQNVFGQNLDVHTLLIDDRGRGFSEAIDCEELHLGTLVASKYCSAKRIGQVDQSSLGRRDIGMSPSQVPSPDVVQVSVVRLADHRVDGLDILVSRQGQHVVDEHVGRTRHAQGG